MKNSNLKYILSWIMYCAGIIMYIIFLALADGISDEAWLYALGASIGVVLYTLGALLKDQD